MGYWSGAWGSLKFSAGRTGEDMLNSVSYRYLKKKDGNLKYINNRGYGNVFIHVAKQTAMQLIEQQVNALFPRYQRYLESKLRDTVLEQQDANLKKLIEAGEKVNKDFGSIEVSGHKIIAKNKYGDLIPEALMLYYESNKEIEVQDVVVQNGKSVETSYKTKTVCFIDLIASVTMQSSKNLVLTQVQGRDFTRKELVSGGDLTFSVSGKMVGNDRGVYPENDVRKFIQLAQYGGVIKVNHFLFQQFNIEQILIKDFNFGASDRKNEQPYNFTCVAVEPDEDVSIIADTIGVLNAEIAISPMNKWYKFILNNKLSSIVSDTITSNVTSGVGSGLDALVPNI